MEEKSRGCFKQTAIGCGCLVVLGVAIPIVLATMIMLPMNRAIESRTELEERFGAQDAFVPPPSGAPAPERIEVFLKVRQALTPICGDFWNAERAVARLEAIGDEEDPSKMAVIRQAMSTSKTMMGMGSLIGHFYETRNRALVDAEMGLGEYTYIYVLAYHDELVSPTEELQLFGPEAVNRRVHGALRSMLEHQLERVRRDGGSDDTVAALEAELKSLEDDPRRIPWQSGLPPAIAASILPYREELELAYCGSTPPLELMINEKRSLAIETR